MISDLVIGSNSAITLLVKSSETKFTKARKPYLEMEMFDGMDSIKAIDWEFGDKQPPPKNTILDLEVSVSEWAGNKQLKINKGSRNTVLGIEHFSPKGDVDIPWYKDKFLALIESCRNEHVKDLLGKAFNDHLDLWLLVPSAKSIHHAFVAGNLKHSVDVALKAQALAKVMPWVNEDLCVAGGLLQDFGKLWTYELDGAIIDMSLKGKLIEHIAIGIAKLEAYRTPENTEVLDLILHIVASHHSKVEYGSPTTPIFLEAWIVAACDGLDSKSQVIYELNAKCGPDAQFTAKVWPLENREQLTQLYVDKVMS